MADIETLKVGDVLQAVLPAITLEVGKLYIVEEGEDVFGKRCLQVEVPPLRYPGSKATKAYYVVNKVSSGNFVKATKQ